MDTTKTLVTLSEAAKIAGVSRQTIHNWLNQGKLHRVYIMGLPYIQTEELHNLKRANAT